MFKLLCLIEISAIKVNYGTFILWRAQTQTPGTFICIDKRDGQFNAIPQNAMHRRRCNLACHYRTLVGAKQKKSKALREVGCTYMVPSVEFKGNKCTLNPLWYYFQRNKPNWQPYTKCTSDDSRSHTLNIWRLELAHLEGWPPSVV